MTQSFTGEEFAKALAEGRLKEPIVKVGMVKQGEGNDGAILFAEAAVVPTGFRSRSI